MRGDFFPVRELILQDCIFVGSTVNSCLCKLLPTKLRVRANIPRILRRIYGPLSSQACVMSVLLDSNLFMDLFPRNTCRASVVTIQTSELHMLSPIFSNCCRALPKSFVASS